MANELEKKYPVLIEQAITDFDAIFNALAAKSVKHGNVVLGTEGAKIDDGIATSQYASFISSQLYKIDGAVVAPNGVVANKGNESVAVTNPGVSYSGGNVVVSGTLAEAAYYDTKSSAISTIAGSKVTLSGASLASGSAYNLEQDASKIIVTPLDGHIINEIEIGKGSAEINLQESNIKATLSASATAKKSGGTATEAVLVDANSDVPAGSYTVIISAESSYSGKVEVEGGTSVTPGYVTELTETSKKAEKNIDVTAGNSATYTVALPKATISGISGSGTASLEVPTGIVTYKENPGDAYEIKATGTIEIDSGSANITEGYIKASDGIKVDAAGSGVTGQTLFIKHGKLGTADENKETVAIELGKISLDTTKGKYTASATVNQTYSKDIVDGYIPSSEKTFSAKLSGSNTFELNKAVATVTTDGTKLGGSGDSIFTQSEVAGGKHYTVTATTAFGKSFTAGYLGAQSEITVPETQTETLDIWVASGSVTPSTTLTAKAISGTKDDDGIAGVPDGESIVDIFVDTPDETRDYYEISAKPSATVSAGYVDGGTVNGTEKKTYLPKAKVQYVTSDNETSFIQVTQGGYLPSGLIADITDIAGSIDYAEVKVGITDNFDAALDAGVDYTLGLSRGTINAGYISQANGTIGLNSTYTVAHGSATLNGENVVSIEAVPTLVEDGKYSFAANSAATINFALTKEGYIKIEDITSSALAKNFTVSGSTATLKVEDSDALVLNKAALSIGTGSKITLGEDTAKTVETQSAESRYYVKPVISAGTVVAEVGTAGYLSANDTVSLEVEAAEAHIYIKEGTALTTVANEVADTVSTIPLTYAISDSKYVFTLPTYDIAVKGELTPGYYGADIKNVSGKATVAAKTLSLDAAALTVSETLGQASLDSQVVLHAESDSNHEYLAITANAEAAVGVTLNKEGYISDKSQATVTDITVTGKTKYIEVLNENRKDIDEVTYNTITVGGQNAALENEIEADLMTAGKYAVHNTKVILHEDAMGSAVEANLKRLETRLAGLLARS